MGGELLDSSPSISYTETFYKQFPFYLSIGMTYDLYWNGDCLLPKYYRESYKMSRDRINQELWLQGAYIYDALCKVSPILNAFAKSGTKPQPYPEKPYSLEIKDIKNDKKDREKANRQRAKAMFQAWASKLKLPDKKEVSADGNND